MNKRYIPVPLQHCYNTHEPCPKSGYIIPSIKSLHHLHTARGTHNSPIYAQAPMPSSVLSPIPLPKPQLESILIPRSSLQYQISNPHGHSVTISTAQAPHRRAPTTVQNKPHHRHLGCGRHRCCDSTCGSPMPRSSNSLNQFGPPFNFSSKN